MQTLNTQRLARGMSVLEKMSQADVTHPLLREGEFKGMPAHTAFAVGYGLPVGKVLTREIRKLKAQKYLIERRIRALEKLGAH